jgi:Transmembrane domain of unknown function (DUF3566)
MSVRSGDNLVRVGSEEDDLDRLTNTPDGSGGASPTVTASRQDDDDLMADHDQDTQPTDLMALPPARTPRTPVAAKDASANGGPVPDGNRKADPAGADSAATATEAVPALPADSIGSPREASAFSFTRPVAAPVSPGVQDRTPSDPGDSPTVEEPAPDVQDTRSPIDSPFFRPASTTERASEDVSSRASSPPEPSPPTVSAAAFTWEVPEPPPTSPSSPARSFLRSSGNAKASAPPAAPSTAPPVTVKPAKPAAGRAPAPAKPQKGSAQRPARQAHLTVARVEPWSVMKFSFVVSIVAFVILFVAVSILYGTLSALGVFDSLQRVVTSVTSSQDSAGVNAAKWWSASRVLGYTGLLGSVNIVLITAMSTIGAVVYNLTSRLIGGVEVTLRETE